jgi:hypothetical protein
MVRERDGRLGRNRSRGGRKRPGLLRRDLRPGGRLVEPPRRFPIAGGLSACCLGERPVAGLAVPAAARSPRQYLGADGCSARTGGTQRRLDRIRDDRLGRRRRDRVPLRSDARAGRGDRGKPGSGRPRSHGRVGRRRDDRLGRDDRRGGHEKGRTLRPGVRQLAADAAFTRPGRPVRPRLLRRWSMHPRSRRATRPCGAATR